MRTTRHERARTSLSRLTLLVAFVFWAGTATAAQVYQMTTGVWGRGDGHEVDVPFVGNSIYNCTFLKQGLNINRVTGVGTPISQLAIGSAVAYGCPSGMGMITATAHQVGAAFTLPPHVISRPPVGYIVAVPLDDNPDIIQAATTARWRIPHSTRGMGADEVGAMTQNPLLGSARDIGPNYRLPAACVGAACTNLAPFRRFHRDAWKGGPASSFDGQTGRVGPNFTWVWGCPGGNAAGPGVGCVTINQGTKPMIVRYKAGPRRFGGTMNQIVNTIAPGSLFLQLPNSVVVDILDAGVGAIQVEGRGYADFITDLLPAATKAFSYVVVADQYVPILMMSVALIQTLGQSHTPAPGPFVYAQFNEKYGFPLTTGTVIVRRTSPVPPRVVTITAMGFDCIGATGNRGPMGTAASCANATGMGARNISLVTGGLSRLSILGVKSANMSQLFLPEPSRTGQLLSGVLVLLAVAAWRSRRPRR